ncbi:MAG: menaquinone biosynthetic enzyme MqnA/MqnD family protein [Elusimicrobiota bacterium]
MKNPGPDGALKVGRIPYLNTDPFFADWPESKFPVTKSFPSQLMPRSQREDLDAGPMPLVDFWNAESGLEPVGDFGIAVKGPALSVFLFSRKPMGALQSARIGVTDQSSTSVMLLKVLLAHRHGVQADLTAGPDGEAKLLIGDEALQAADKGVPGLPHVTDLGRAWHDWKRLPFVFARWVVRRTAPAYLKAELADSLDRSLRSFETDPEPIVRAGAKRLNLSPARVRDYFSGFTYRLGESEKAAEAEFRSLLTGRATRCLC